MAEVAINRVDGSNQDFKSLVELLDKELETIDGEDHDFYHQYNTIHDIKYATVLYLNEKPVACGAIKDFNESAAEIKRMFVLNEFRGNGYAIYILSELEKWAKELGYKKTILETGKRQIAAVNLYKKYGYSDIPNYGQYFGVENSICFEKKL